MNDNPQPKEYRLGSSPMISAPGVIAWAINGYAFPRDRKNMVRIIRDGWDIPEHAAIALLSCRLPSRTRPSSSPRDPIPG